ncbi:MAG: ribonuclease Z [Gemmatimonadota bacterium]|nr:MAG: ribonuclease Z [Gemmatimonadota bacterium]
MTLGTGTVVPDPDRASACHWLEQEETRLILDCGAGALQSLARADLPWAKVDHLLIRHFHADHIAEIPALIFALRHALEVPRTAALHVWGPAGTGKLFAAWATAFGTWISTPGFPVEIHELSPGRSIQIGNFRTVVEPTPHTDESLAFRLEGDSILGYTGDTGPTDELGRFFRGADALLAECSLPDELTPEYHLSPSSLARLGMASRTPRLIVTHVYPQLQRQDVPGLIRRAGFTGDVVMAHDGMRLRI